MQNAIVIKICFKILPPLDKYSYTIVSKSLSSGDTELKKPKKVPAQYINKAATIQNWYVLYKISPLTFLTLLNKYNKQKISNNKNSIA